MKKAAILFFAFLLTVSITSTQALAAEWVEFDSKNTDELQKEWEITFSSAVDESTVNMENVYVKDSTGEKVSTDYRVEGDKVFIKPVSNYIPGQTYTLFIGPGIKSGKGQDLKSDVRFSFSVNQVERPKSDMLVHFIDVGQGDSILIQAPGGKNMLVDGGTKASGTKVVSFLKSKGVSTLDVVIATHPDADHIGGLISVLNNFKVNQFIDSGRVHTTQTYYEMLQLIDDKNIPFKVAKTGDAIDLDALLKTTVLHADEIASSTNDASIVTRLEYGSVSFLLTGDAEKSVESKILSQYGNIQSTYLKAGHHGSNSSSTAAFINAVKPLGTILSYAEGNSYGHPHSEVVARLGTVGSKIYSTAESGDITITTDGVKHSVSVAPWTPPVEPSPNPEPKPDPKPEPGLEVKPGAPSKFKNCTEMRVYYPNGVKVGHPSYEKKHDRDGDGWACE